MMLSLSAAFVAGLLGSAHCIGMCGGFVALLGVGTDGRVASRQAAYFLGKTGTYAAFGAVAGAAGFALREAFAGLGGVVAVGLGGRWWRPGWPSAAWRGASGRRARAGGPPRAGGGPARRVGPAGAIVALGALNGLLPCGLVYGMLAVAAASGSAAGGALTMAAFGLATIPALAVTGALGARLRPSRRLWLQRLAGALVVAMGLLTIVRGAHALAPAHGTAEAATCDVAGLP